MPTALITGASGGIGAAIAEALAPTHTLLLVGRSSARLDAVAERLGATTWPLDLTDIEEIEAGAELLDELDVLVHNAGVAYPGRVGESTPELLPALRAARGQVVFINSGAGLNVSPGLAAYSASKFALRAFADSLRADEPLLRVTSIHPGRVDTEMQRDLVAYEGGDYEPARFLTPQTVATAVVQAVNTPPDAHTHQVVIRPR
jgi:NADP-dependent 3-hydroxy acid dehydrogenase YdfG